MLGYIEMLESLKSEYGNHIEDFSVVCVKLQNYDYVKELGRKYEFDFLKQYEEEILGLLSENEKIIASERNKLLLVLNNKSVDEFLKYLSLMTVPFDDQYISMKCKTGVYNIKLDDSVEQIMDNVEMALKTTEQECINNTIYTEKCRLDVMKRQEIITYFSNAILNNEFEVYYQPKIDLTTNALCGSEALVRWYKDGNIVLPNDFIPVLEKDDLICKLDFYVLESVCKDIKVWLDNGVIPTTTSINFSKNNLKNPNFSSDVIDILEKYDIDHKYIEVEITESSETLDYNAMYNFVESMKKNNINISIDDFGTGSSTLNLIKKMSANTIKIDKSFIDNIQDKRDAILVKTIIELALSLGMDVIAEGTETKEQIDILYQLGCGKIQGYYFDKPLPKDEYIKRLESKGKCYTKQFSALTFRN